MKVIQVCGKCKKNHLLFEMVAAGIRVKREKDGKFFYSARCPKCGDFDIEATP